MALKLGCFVCKTATPPLDIPYEEKDIAGQKLLYIEKDRLNEAVKTLGWTFDRQRHLRCPDCPEPPPNPTRFDREPIEK